MKREIETNYIQNRLCCNMELSENESVEENRESTIKLRVDDGLGQARPLFGPENAKPEHG